MKRLALFGIIGLLAACSNYVYSPSVLLPEDATGKGGFDMKGGVGKFPKTKPNKPYTTEGGIIELGYGINNKVSVYGSAWTDLSNDQIFLKGGLGLAAQIQIWEFSRSRLVTQPKVALLKNGSKFDAMGFQLPIIYIQSLPKGFYAYSGISYGYGNRWLNENASKSEYLNAAIGHLGFGYNISGSFWLVFECNPTLQNNHYYNRNQWLCSGVLSFGYRIESPYKNTKYKSKR